MKITPIVLIIVCLLVFVLACTHQPDMPVPQNNNTGKQQNEKPCNPDSVYFKNDILPLLISKCAQKTCHDAQTKADGVWLDSWQNVMNSDVVDKGRADKSDMYEVLN